MEFFWGLPLTISDNEQRLYFRGDDEPDYGHEVLLSEGPWRFLPVPALLHVFEYLEDRDRFSASLTCKPWADMFNHPYLWRNRHFRFAGFRTTRNDCEKAMAYAKRFGKYLRHLQLCCEHPTFSMCKKFQRTMADFIGVLIWRNCQLREVSIPRIHADRYWRYDSLRDRLVNSFARFLRKQSQLKEFDMCEGGFNIQNGFKILEALISATKSKHKLHTLNIEDFFQPRLAVFRATKYLNIFNGFKNLVSLYVNYNCLNDDTLKILARNCAGTLRFLSIKVYKNDPNHHRLDPVLWKQLRHMCPYLKVTMYFECIGQHRDIVRALSREMPLTSLQIWTGVHHQDEEWNLQATLRYIGDTYSYTLEEITLGLETSRETIDDAFLYMLGKLKRLEDLDVQSTLTIDTIEQLLQLQQEYTIGLMHCHINLEDLLPIELEDLQEVTQSYNDMIDQRGLDFRFDSNETILI